MACWSWVLAVACALSPSWWCYLINQDHFFTILLDIHLISFLAILMAFWWKVQLEDSQENLVYYWTNPLKIEKGIKRKERQIFHRKGGTMKVRDGTTGVQLLFLPRALTPLGDWIWPSQHIPPCLHFSASVMVKVTDPFWQEKYENLLIVSTVKNWNTMLLSVIKM